jgi:hypothetical protein
MQKQLTGLVGVQPKNELQREMSRLQIDPFQLYNPYREKNPALEVLTQAALQGTLPAAIKADLLDLEEYKNAEPSMKKRAIQEYVKNKITSTRQTSEEILKGMQGKSPDFDAYIRGEVQAMTFKEARDADLHWEGIRGDLGYEGMNHKQALKFIQSDTELDDMEKQARQTTLNMIYLAGQKETTKVLRSIGK